MSCCSSRRASLTSAPQLRAAAHSAPAAEAPPLEPRLRFLGPTPFSVRGPFSGRVYTGACRAELTVDPRDSEALLRTGLFELLLP